jgi:xylulokinase
MLYIGIDLGTSAVKLLLMDGGGRILKTVSREYPLYFPHPGWSEQNPSDWLEQTILGVRELTADCDKSSIAGIGCGGQMHGLVALDAEDRVLRPAILWNDGRTAAETEYLNTVVGKDTLSRCTANIAFAGFTAPKLLWMRKNEPELFARIAKIMLPKDYINYMLTGVHCTDVSDASGMLLFDVEHKRWSREMLDICGVREEQMARIYESSDVVGTLLPAMAEKLGLPAGVKICAGAGDNAAAAVGTGTVGDGRATYPWVPPAPYSSPAKISAWTPTTRSTPSPTPTGTITSWAACSPPPPATSGGWRTCWARRITQPPRAESTDDMLGRNRVFFLPYLMGERSPHNDPAARGTFIGLTMDTRRTDMTQAVLEGVAFGMRDSMEVARSLGIGITRSKICGGGARSPLWRKIFANVLNIDIDTVETEEGPGYGGAILAAVACGEFPSVEAAADTLVHITGTQRPDAEIAARYEERYRKFREIYPTVRGLFRTLA